MNRYNFLNKTSSYSYTNDIDKMCQLISNNCREYLRAAGTSPLYRGMANNIKASGIIAPPPVDRPPKNSTTGFNFMFNAAMDLSFGIEFARAKSLFVSGSYSQAKMYGHVAYVFPIGSFKSLWSPQIYDSYEDCDQFYDIVATTLSDSLGYDLSRYNIEALFDYLSGHYTYDAFLNFPDDKIDKILIGAAKQISADPLLENAFRKKQSVSLAKYFTQAISSISEYYKNNSEIKSAIDRRNEISLYECSGYYAITELALKNLIKKADIGAGSFVEKHGGVFEIRDSDQLSYEFLLDYIENSTKKPAF